MRIEEAPVWVPHGPNCICRPCRLARVRAERILELEVVS